MNLRELDPRLSRVANAAMFEVPAGPGNGRPDAGENLARGVMETLSLHGDIEWNGPNTGRYRIEENGIQLNFYSLDEAYVITEQLHVVYWNLFSQLSRIKKHLEASGHQAHLLTVDIGAHTGISTIALAAGGLKQEGFHPKGIKEALSHGRPDEVVAYELVPSTRKILYENIGLNPTIAQRITVHDCGLGDSDRIVDVCVDPNLRGAYGIGGNNITGAGATFGYENNAHQWPKESAQIRDAARELADVIQEAWRKHPNHIVVPSILIDAEMAEMEILPRLAQYQMFDGTSVFSHIAVIEAEWHRDARTGEQSLDTLTELFDTNGFISVVRDPHNETSGWITGVNSNLFHTYQNKADAQ